MDEINQLDEAQIRHEFRQFVKDHGYKPAVQALYEMLFAANVLCEVIIEEGKKLESE